MVSAYPARCPLPSHVRRRAAVALAASVVVAVATPLSAAAATVPLTMDALPALVERPAAGAPVPYVVSGDVSEGNTVTLSLLDPTAATSTPVCGPVTGDASNRWTCSIPSLPDHFGQLEAQEAGSSANVYRHPLQVIGAPTIDPATQDLTSADTTPTFSGTVPPGGVASAVEVTVDGLPGCTTTAVPGGTWSCTIDDGVIAVDRTYAVAVTQTKDFGGGNSLTSDPTATTYTLATPVVVIPLPTTSVPPPVVITPPTTYIPPPASTGPIDAAATYPLADLDIRLEVTTQLAGGLSTLCDGGDIALDDSLQSASGSIVTANCGAVPQFTALVPLELTLPLGSTFAIVSTLSPHASGSTTPTLTSSAAVAVYLASHGAFRALDGGDRPGYGILLDRAPFDGSELTLNITLPADTPPGENALVFVLSLDDFPDEDPVAVRVPFLLEPAPAPVEPEGVDGSAPAAWWPWLLVAALVALVAAATVLVVRRLGRADT